MATKQQAGSHITQARKRQEKADRKRRRNRRRLLLGIGAAVVVAAGVVVTIVLSAAAENRAYDLSGIGDGVPAVVQVHDATCPICSELRANVRRIEGEFSDEALLVRVADIHTSAGLDFAARYTNERRRTLLFIDGNGELVDVQTGLQDVAALRRSFEAHANGRL